MMQTVSRPQWLVLEGRSLSYGKATPYLPITDLLKGYFQLAARDGAREIHAKVQAGLRTLDPALEPDLPALLALLDVSADDARWQALDPAVRRQRTLDAVRALLLRESQRQPLLLVLEDLQWVDRETQALLDGLVERMPRARIFLLANFRPEYQDGWGGKTYYTRLRPPPARPRERGRAAAGAARSRARPGSPQAPPDRAHGRQPLLPGGERADARRDRRARGRAGAVPRGAAAGGHPDAGDGAVHPRRAPRSPARPREAPAPVGLGHRQGRALRPAPGARGRPGGTAAPGAGPPAGRRVPVRDEPLPRPRVHVQARAHPRGRLRRAAARPAPRAPRAPGVGHRAAGDRAGSPSRWTGWLTTRSRAACGRRRWSSSARPAPRPPPTAPTGKPSRAPSRRWTRSGTCRPARSGTSRRWTSGWTCTMR